MKKLMCAIAAAAAGVALADVQSANIVGYATSTIEKMGQQQMIGGQFVSVGEDSINIQDIKVTGALADESVWIKWWDPAKKTYGVRAVYVSELYEGGEAIVPKTAGWGDADWEILDKDFVPGEGFWWGAGNDNCSLTISGEVVQESNVPFFGCVIDKMGQQKMVINALPMDVNIQDLQVDGALADESAWIKWWDPVKKTYGVRAVYVSELYEGGEAIVPKTSGWGDPDWEILDKDFVSGEGFWFGAGNDNCTLKIPNPFHVKPESK